MIGAGLRAAGFGAALLGFLVLTPAYALLRAMGSPLAPRLRQTFCRVLTRFLRLRMIRHGAPEGGALIVANHVSWTDILLFGAAPGPIVFLAKREVGGWPLLGLFARVDSTIFITRGRKREIPSVNRAIARALGEGRPVALFAEATTGDGTRLLPFSAVHAGALRDRLAAAPDVESVAIQPAAIAYVRRGGLPLGVAGRADVAWHGDTTLLPHLWSLSRGAPVDAVVVFGPPFAFHRGDDRKAAMAEARRRVRAMLLELRRETPA